MAPRRPSSEPRHRDIASQLVHALRPRNLQFIALAFLIIGTFFGLLPANELEGTAEVTDGDSLIIAGARIRLYGIDAPEQGQPCHDGEPCGQRARNHLAGLVAGHRLTCELRDLDRYGREVAQCYLVIEGHDGKPAKGADIGRAMVRDGQAMAYRDITRLYVPDEPARFDFAPPWDWRAQHDTTAKKDHR